MWILGIALLLVLLIPLTAIVLDSEVGRALARRLGSGERDEAGPRIETLEEEVQYLSETVQSLQEETSFIRKLLEDREESTQSLPPGED